MEIGFSKNKIEFKKELNALDRLTIQFTSIINGLKIKHVLVSGYVAILFGRSRASEDIDIIAEKLEFARFEEMWKETIKQFDCLNVINPKDAYYGYLPKGHAIRFSRKGKAIPNIEFKFPKVELDRWAITYRKTILLNNNHLFISPLELQIAYKLFLGSDKDIEDAVYLYRLFKKNLDTGILQEFVGKLKVHPLFKKHCK